MHEEWTDQLSDYLDGELSNEERDAVDAHLQECGECTAVLNDLKRVVARAQTIEPRPPHADLWRGIASRIEDEPRRAAQVAPFVARPPRRVAFSLPQLAAAAALVAAASSGLAWQIAARSARPSQPSVDSASATLPAAHDTAVDAVPADVRVENVGLADAQYDAAVADLEKALKNGRGQLDASTIAIVEHNLQIIDRAIDQARQALVTDPANNYLSSHLVEARRRKLDLLRRATALTTETN